MMIYCPMIKTKRTEKKAMTYLAPYFDNNWTIPYIEIVNRWVMEKTPKNDGQQPIISLKDYIGVLNENQLFFLSIFRTASIIKEEKNSIYLHDLNQHVEKYVQELKRLSSIPNAIIVFEIRSENELEYAEEYADFVRKNNLQLCVRFSCASRAVIKWAKETIRDNEYAFFDVDLRAEDDEIEVSNDLLLEGLDCRLIPIRTNRTNKSPLLPSDEQETAIWSKDSAKAVEVIYPDGMKWVTEWNKNRRHLYGWADYCGLKNNLAVKGGGQTRKFAFLYSEARKTYRLYSTKQAEEQFDNIFQMFFDEKNVLDPNGICPAYELVNSWKGGRKGNFASWNAVSLVRYVSQVATAIRKLSMEESSI